MKMGLIKDYYQPQFEVTIPNCYWRVELREGIRGGKEKLHVRLNCFKNKEVADADERKYADYDFEFTPDLESQDNFIKQAYDYIKSLPSFSDAVDA